MRCNPARVETIPSWEQVAGDTGQHPPDARLNPIAAAEAMKQLIALGYIAPPPNNAQNLDLGVCHGVEIQPGPLLR